LLIFTPGKTGQLALADEAPGQPTVQNLQKLRFTFFAVYVLKWQEKPCASSTPVPATRHQPPAENSQTALRLGF
jgi:hypothetical protein